MGWVAKSGKVKLCDGDNILTTKRGVSALMAEVTATFGRLRRLLQRQRHQQIRFNHARRTALNHPLSRRRRRRTLVSPGLVADGAGHHARQRVGDPPVRLSGQHVAPLRQDFLDCHVRRVARDLQVRHRNLHAGQVALGHDIRPSLPVPWVSRRLHLHSRWCQYQGSGSGDSVAPRGSSVRLLLIMIIYHYYKIKKMFRLSQTLTLANDWG